MSDKEWNRTRWAWRLDRFGTLLAWIACMVAIGMGLTFAFTGEFLYALFAAVVAGFSHRVARWHPVLITFDDDPKDS